MLTPYMTSSATLRRAAGLALAATCLLISAPAQTAPAKPASTATTHKASAGAASTASKLPANIPVARGLTHSLYSLRYIDTKIGTGAVAEPGKLYTVNYTGWLHDGTKFDSSFDHGKPIDFPQGMHRVIPGWDTGFAGMHIGGKRRLFIPWQLAYGEQGRGPIPPKADLIFDIELVDVKDLPKPPTMPTISRPAPVPPPATPTAPATQPATPPPAAAPASPPAPQPATPPTATQPATPPAPEKPNQ
jgi:peptidylprolyl isomerase